METNINVKFSLWREINSYINRLEATYPKFLSLLVAVAGVLLTFIGSNYVSKMCLLIKLILLIATPLLVAIVMAYLSYNFRLVAIARRYAVELEDDLNSSLDEQIFKWNNEFVDKYLANKNFINTKFLPLLSLSFFVFIETFLNIFMWKIDIAWYWKVIYTFLVTLMFVCCGAPFINNEKIRKGKY